MKAGNPQQVLTISLSVAPAYLPVFMPELLPINQLFSLLVLSESLSQLLAPYFQATRSLCPCSLFPAHVYSKLIPEGSRAQNGRGVLSGMLCNAMENSFVLASFVSETGWWLTGHGNKLISCLSFFFLGLKTFPVHKWPCLIPAHISCSSIGIFILFQFSVLAATWFSVPESPMENIQADSELYCEGHCELGKILSPS